MSAVLKSTTETYIDAQGNKVVQPVYNGSAGTVGGVVGITK